MIREKSPLLDINITKKRAFYIEYYNSFSESQGQDIFRQKGGCPSHILVKLVIRWRFLNNKTFDDQGTVITGPVTG